jgi:hypothetical protein
MPKILNHPRAQIWQPAQDLSFLGSGAVSEPCGSSAKRVRGAKLCAAKMAASEERKERTGDVAASPV